MNDDIILPDAMYTTEGLSRAIGMNERVIRDKAKKGELPAYKYGKRWFFLGSEVIEAIKNTNKNS